MTHKPFEELTEAEVQALEERDWSSAELVNAIRLRQTLPHRTRGQGRQGQPLRRRRGHPTRRCVHTIAAPVDLRTHVCVIFEGDRMPCGGPSARLGPLRT